MVGHELPHSPLLQSKFIDLLPRVVGSAAAPTKTTFDVLNGVCTGSKAAVSADGARDFLGTMDLHVHLKAVLAAEFTVANPALIDGRRRWVHATPAPAVSLAFPPLVAAELATT
mmetsp:Transcript_11530/g.26743  ORF Transcript_11530/g.26743 Transcript_11530/m.26743 type:complete len:114 (-) Transcript_11530:320-661(-)